MARDKPIQWMTRARTTRTVVVYDATKGDVVHTYQISSKDDELPSGEVLGRDAIDTARRLSRLGDVELKALEIPADVYQTGKRYRVDPTHQRLIVLDDSPHASI
jgi:hypothetical protein